MVRRDLKYKHCVVCMDRYHVIVVLTELRALFDRANDGRYLQIEVPGTWRYTAVHDLRVTSGANGSNGRTTYFDRHGMTGQRFCRGLTNREG